jgi:hypothetical protein
MADELESGWETFLREEQPIDAPPSVFDLGSGGEAKAPTQRVESPLPLQEKKEEEEQSPPWDPREALRQAEKFKRIFWFIFDREPGMDDIYDRAGDSLEPMVDKLSIHPFQDSQGNPRLFLAQYEFPKDQEDFQNQDCIFVEEAAGLIDFLAGFPIESVEMLGMVGEYSTKKDEMDVVPGGGGSVAPMPLELFAGMPPEKILLNTSFLEEEGQGQVLVDITMAGGIAIENLHWWVRTNIKKDAKFPIPGEFLGLAVRMMPDVPWGKQKSSPFFFSGNWMDTIFYTSGRIKEVIAPDNTFPYPRYRVQWRKDVVEATPSDFAEYQVGDRVTILKEVDTNKKSQLWNDDDVKEFDTEKWIIVPLTHYNDLGKKED